MSQVGSVIGGEVVLAAAQATVTPATDGTAKGSISAGTTGTMSLAVGTANDIIIVAIATTGALVSSVTSANYTYTKKAVTDSTSTLHVEYWTAPAVATHTDTITVTLASSGNAAFLSFALKNPYFTEPYDFAALASNQGSSTNANVSVTTTDPTTILIGLHGFLNGGTYTAGAGFTKIDSQAQGSNVSIGAEYQVVTATQSAVTVNATLGTTGTWAAICDAIMANNPNVYTLQATSTQEWDIHNLFWSGAINVAKFNGNNLPVLFYNPSGAGDLTSIFIHVTTSTHNLVFVNASVTTTVTIGTDGVRTI